MNKSSMLAAKILEKIRQLDCQRNDTLNIDEKLKLFERILKLENRLNKIFPTIYQDGKRKAVKNIGCNKRSIAARLYANGYVRGVIETHLGNLPFDAQTAE